MRESRTPLIIAIVVLLVPVLYVGSYLVLVRPRSQLAVAIDANGLLYSPKYRFGGTIAERVFWPLEQIDRKLRPRAWQPGFLHDYRSLQIEQSLGGEY